MTHKYTQTTLPPRAGVAGSKEWTLKQACFQGYPESAVYVQVPIGSRNPAIHNAYHTLLCPSSLLEPRHRSLKVNGRVRRTAKKCNAARKNSSQREGDNKYWKEVTSTHPALLPLSFCMEASMQSPSPHKTSRQYIHNGIKWMRANDPSAGSPTETLLRLLLPLSDKVHQTFRCNIQELNIAAV